MIYLLLSIISSSFLVLTFKYFERYKIDNFQGAVFNYIVAASLGFGLNYKAVQADHIFSQSWVPYAVFMGLLFISMINIIAITTQRNGVSVATVATKTSLIIPVYLAIYLYNEQMNILKISGIALAVCAVFMVSKKEKSSNPTVKIKYPYLLPGILFIATGIADTVIKFVQAKHAQPHEFGIFISMLFAVAAIAGSLVVAYQIIFQHKKVYLRNFVGGLILGCINYGTLYFLMKTLDRTSFGSAVVFPVNNMGVVIFSAIVAAVVFKEKMSPLNKTGILVAVLAIALITFS
jgi:drug/metabolite transporter (DMT)-like permease